MLRGASGSDHAPFRPSDVVVGTDDAVQVADRYDPGVGGHPARDAEVYGRIVRIAPEDDATRSPALAADGTTGPRGRGPRGPVVAIVSKTPHGTAAICHRCPSTVPTPYRARFVPPRLGAPRCDPALLVKGIASRKLGGTSRAQYGVGSVSGGRNNTASGEASSISGGTSRGASGIHDWKAG
jgi:hypothetical protein